jgi:hypothetical protein
MMMTLPTSVECSAKKAMTALRGWPGATGLLPDLDQPQRILLRLRAMHSFQSHAFKLHGDVIEARME